MPSVPVKKLSIIFLINIGAALVCLTSCIKGEPYSSSPTDNFEALWQLLDERYCFFDYKRDAYGLDWDEVHERYSSLVNDSLTNRQLFDVLSAMVNELRDGHTNLIWDFGTSRYTGFYAGYPRNFDSELISRTLGTDYYYTSGIYYTRLPENIGYLYIGSFSTSFSQRLITEIFRYFEPCIGLIIDVRDNGGGDLTLAQDLAARFMEEKTLVGYIAHKTGPAHDAFSEPQPVYVEPDTTLLRWDRPVCVLCNRLSYSATNDFVRNMRLLPQVTIVGDRTGGGSGLPMSTELPNGWSLRYSSSPMYDVEMQHTEFGIDPDVPVNILAADRQRGVDTIVRIATLILQGGV